MEITINDQRKIFAVQKEFNEMFPFLKLGFYKKSSKVGEEPSAKRIKHISKTIAECSSIHSSEYITIKPQMTIGEVEQAFRNMYGLPVHVFKKCANAWYDITEYAGWTLQNQNEEGKELSNAVQAI